MHRDGRSSCALALAVALGVGAIRCTLFAPTDAELRGSAVPSPVGEAGTTAGSDASSSVDGAVTEFHDIATASFWSVFDTASALATAGAFAGAVVAGHYLYLAPGARGAVVRYDLQGDFTSPGSWAAFDASAFGTNAFQGASFDGKYVYFVPNGGSGQYSGTVVRYEIGADFEVKTSWSSFDTRTLTAQAEGFVGAVFDGRYLYLVPNRNTTHKAEGVIVRYDTSARFDLAGSWSVVDLQYFNTYGQGFAGGVFDGQYVYLVPYDNLSPTSSVAARYDTASSFGDAGSWTFFAMSNNHAAGGGFFGGAFDGRYVYFAPQRTEVGRVFTRFDTQGSFLSSWTYFDPTAWNSTLAGMAGAVFDGRFVYFVPYTAGQSDGIVVRHDTAGGSFSDSTAWSTFDTRSLHPSAGSFIGGAFDGRYVYFVPNGGSVVARFDAKTPPLQPALPAFSGSFF